MVSFAGTAEREPVDLIWGLPQLRFHVSLSPRCTTTPKTRQSHLLRCRETRVTNVFSAPSPLSNTFVKNVRPEPVTPGPAKPIETSSPPTEPSTARLARLGAEQRQSFVSLRCRLPAHMREIQFDFPRSRLDTGGHRLNSPMCCTTFRMCFQSRLLTFGRMYFVAVHDDGAAGKCPRCVHSRTQNGPDCVFMSRHHPRQVPRGWSDSALHVCL